MAIEILEIGTLVKTINGTIGYIGGDDRENSNDDLSDLNYYVVPHGKSFDDNEMVHYSEVEVLKIKKQSDWLYNDTEIKDELNILQENFLKAGYRFSLEECYDIWMAYSDMLSANWIGVDETCVKALDTVLFNTNIVNTIDNIDTIELIGTANKIDFKNKEIVAITLHLDEIKTLKLKEMPKWLLKPYVLFSYKIKRDDLDKSEINVLDINEVGVVTL